LPVEWETETFEKYEPPYRREGGGLTLAELALDETPVNKQALLTYIDTSLAALKTFEADSITSQLESYHHFFLANRLYLLNLAAVYTTGFECPDMNEIIPELRNMLSAVQNIYSDFNAGFASTPLSGEYLELYDKAIKFANTQPADFTLFDHFALLKDFINPLFRLNQQFISQYDVRTISQLDISLENNARSIFDKRLFNSQNARGIFSLVDDEKMLAEIKSMESCFFMIRFFQGTVKEAARPVISPRNFLLIRRWQPRSSSIRQQHLPRNTPSLVNSVFNHLVMLDGKHIALQGPGKRCHSESEGNEHY
jgi:cytochrome c peroxidase